MQRHPAPAGLPSGAAQPGGVPVQPVVAADLPLGAMMAGALQGAQAKGGAVPVQGAVPVEEAIVVPTVSPPEGCRFQMRSAYSMRGS